MHELQTAQQSQAAVLRMQRADEEEGRWAVAMRPCAVVSPCAVVHLRSVTARCAVMVAAAGRLGARVVVVRALEWS